MSYRLVLASQSPRRAEILAEAGLAFTVRVPDVEERRREGETPEEYVLRLAREKAASVPCGAGEAVLGADTVVVVDDQVLEKPRDGADAARMLGLLSGRAHRVMTGICLRTAEQDRAEVSTTVVTFTPLSKDEIETYVASGEPRDKAGAYAIQGLAGKFIQRVEGCYFNVVGLPIALVYRHWKEIACEP